MSDTDYRKAGIESFNAIWGAERFARVSKYCRRSPDDHRAPAAFTYSTT
jgi:hypothetical protein